MTRPRRSTPRPSRREASFLIAPNSLSRAIDAALFRRVGGAVLTAAAGLGFALAPTPVRAAVIQVTAGAVDDTVNGNCSLIEAINTANSTTLEDGCTQGDSGPDTLVLPAGSTFTFTEFNSTNDGRNALPTTFSEMTVQGNGAIIERDPGSEEAFRLFHVFSGNLTLQDLTLRNGSATDSTFDDGGGAIFNRGTLNVVGCTVTNNTTAGYGGAMFNYFGGTINIAGSTISGNTASESGGGIINRSSSTVTITNSNVVGNSATIYGGGISNTGTITITDSTLSGNQVTDYYGGGLFSGEGSVTITNSTVSGNTAEKLGGGIHLDDSNAHIKNSNISGNTADVYGGGIYNIDGTTLISESRVFDNLADDGGGGIGNRRGTVTVVNSTIYNNIAHGSGGGIWSITNLTDKVTRVINSTISGNTTTAFFGGGIYNAYGKTEIIHSTITANSSPDDDNGSGVATDGDFDSITYVESSIIAGNLHSDVDFVDGIANNFESVGYNVIGIGNATGAFAGPGDQTNVLDPGLGPLADNGGPTRTHALANYDSPAFNAGNPNFASPPGPPFDQRGLGFPRVIFGRIDVGAYEFAGPIPVHLAVSRLILAEGGTATVSACLPAGITVGVAVNVDVTVAGTAIPATDHNLANPSTITIPVNANCGDITLAATADGIAESPEDVNIAILGLPGGFEAGTPGQVTVTISDTLPPGFLVSPASGLATTEAGGADSFTVLLSTPPAADVTVALSSGDTSEGTLSPAGLIFTTANWNTPQVVTITGVDDDVDDGDIVFTIVTAPASSADPGYNGVEPVDVSVTNIDDDTRIGVDPGAVDDSPNGNCSLVEAVRAANTDAPVDACEAGSGTDTLALPVGSLFSFGISSDATAGANALPSITSPIILEGNGATIERSAAAAEDFRLIHVAASGDFTLHDITLMNGVGSSGGAIFNAGMLSVTGATVSGNTALISGGGIFSSGTLNLAGSTVSANTGYFAGGVQNSDGSATISNSTVSANSAVTWGGGLFVNGGSVTTITNSTLSGNTAVPVSDPYGIINSYGGGIFNSASDVTITNSTISGNSADNYGGGVFSNSAGLTEVFHSTITGNTAPAGNGSGVNMQGGGMLVEASIIAGNTHTDVDGGPFSSAGDNLIGDGGAAGNFTAPGDQTGVSDPGLEPLADNGGPTQTHALISGSPALDAVTGTCPPPDSDQRGAPRPQGAACDIGSFEYGDAIFRNGFDPPTSP